MSRLRDRLRVLMGAALALCTVHAARAETKAGVTMPDTIVIDGKTLQLNGIGLRTFTLLRVHGYVGGLYLTSKADTLDTVLDEPNPKLLSIQFVHDAPASRIHDLYMHSSKEFCRAHTCTDTDRSSFDKLLSTVRPVKAGDHNSFVITDQGVEVRFNDQQLVMIDDPHFGRIVLDSELGTTAPTPEFRDGLLGKDAS